MWQYHIEIVFMDLLNQIYTYVGIYMFTYVCVDTEIRSDIE